MISTEQSVTAAI